MKQLFIGSDIIKYIYFLFILPVVHLVILVNI